MSWKFAHKNTQDYADRIALISKIRRIVQKSFELNVPLTFSPPVTFTHSGGKVSIVNIQWYSYWNEHFKRPFSHIRVALDNGAFVRLEKLRTKHLLPIYQQMKPK
jgi:hypothetical protein